MYIYMQCRRPGLRHPSSLREGFAAEKANNNPRGIPRDPGPVDDGTHQGDLSLGGLCSQTSYLQGPGPETARPTASAPAPAIRHRL